ncbi:MAG TPA: YqgE/AlgH family protein [Bryobacteraceae bacterium]|nr:YqgE/AlgH family protein [Bryobacteraceae bacterium]
MLRQAALAIVTACFVWLSQTPGSLFAAQASAGAQVNAGDILVASEKLGDPNFAQSVVLILEHDDDKGTLGVIINRRSEIPLSRIFPDIKGASADPVFVGGPVSITVVQALLRLPNEMDETTHVLADVYASGSRQVIEKSVRAHVPSSKFRLYVGYAGWAPGQLEAEIQIGAWMVLSNRSKLIFDDNPDSLWSRLTRESHMQVAASRFSIGPLRSSLYGLGASR